MEEFMHIQVNDREAMFQNLFHNLYIPASPSLEWNTGCWEACTDNCLMDFWVFPNGNLSIFTTLKPKSLQYKEPNKCVQHPRNLQLPTLPTLQDCSSWCKLMANQAKSHRRENGLL